MQVLENMDKNNFNVFPSFDDRKYNKKLLLSEMKQAMNPERESFELHPPPVPLKNTNCDPMSEFLSAIREEANESGRNEHVLNSQDSKMEEEWKII